MEIPLGCMYKVSELAPAETMVRNEPAHTQVWSVQIHTHRHE